MRNPLELPTTVHHHAHYRVWQRGAYDLNVWSEKKRNEKINYMRANPVKRRLALHPGEWTRQSWRFYHLGDASLLAMDEAP